MTLIKNPKLDKLYVWDHAILDTRFVGLYIPIIYKAVSYLTDGEYQSLGVSVAIFVGLLERAY